MLSSPPPIQLKKIVASGPLSPQTCNLSAACYFSE